MRSADVPRGFARQSCIDSVGRTNRAAHVIRVFQIHGSFGKSRRPCTIGPARDYRPAPVLASKTGRYRLGI